MEPTPTESLPTIEWKSVQSSLKKYLTKDRFEAVNPDGQGVLANAAHIIKAVNGQRADQAFKDFAVRCFIKTPVQEVRVKDERGSAEYICSIYQDTVSPAQQGSAISSAPLAEARLMTCLRIKPVGELDLAIRQPIIFFFPMKWKNGEEVSPSRPVTQRESRKLLNILKTASLASATNPHVASGRPRSETVGFGEPSRPVESHLSTGTGSYSKGTGPEPALHLDFMREEAHSDQPPDGFGEIGCVEEALSKDPSLALDLKSKKGPDETPSQAKRRALREAAQRTKAEAEKPDKVISAEEQDLLEQAAILLEVTYDRSNPLVFSRNRTEFRHDSPLLLVRKAWEKWGDGANGAQVPPRLEAIMQQLEGLQDQGAIPLPPRPDQSLFPPKGHEGQDPPVRIDPASPTTPKSGTTPVKTGHSKKLFLLGGLVLVIGVAHLWRTRGTSFWPKNGLVG